jgi:hypothetical protein
MGFHLIWIILQRHLPLSVDNPITAIQGMALHNFVILSIKVFALFTCIFFVLTLTLIVTPKPLLSKVQAKKRSPAACFIPFY